MKKNWGQTVTFIGIISMVVVVIGLQIRSKVEGDNLFSSGGTPADLHELINAVVPSDAVIRNAFRSSVGSNAYHHQTVDLFTRDGTSTQALFTKPEGVGPFPVVILLHGGASSPRVTSELSKDVADAITVQLNCAVLVVDWRPAQDEQEDVADVLAAIDWLDSIVELAEQPIVLVGDAYGAYIATAAATDRNVLRTVTGVVALNPLVDLGAHYSALALLNETDAAEWAENIGCGQAANMKRCAEQRSLPLRETTIPLTVLQSEAVPASSEQTEMLMSSYAHITTTPISTTVFSESVEDVIAAVGALLPTVASSESAQQAPVEDDTAAPAPGGLGDANAIEDIPLE